MPKDVRVRFGRRIRQLREERGWTQEDVAKRFGIDRSFLSDIERGHRNVSLITQETLAEGFGITLAKLMAGV